MLTQVPKSSGPEVNGDAFFNLDMLCLKECIYSGEGRFICLGDGDEARNGRHAGGGEEARGSMGRKAETGEKKQVAPQGREGRNYAQEIGN